MLTMLLINLYYLDMNKKIEAICGNSHLIPDFEAIGNNPNFVFENDPLYQTLTLYDQTNNSINVNSWLECANYVNGGWSTVNFGFVNYEQYLTFILVGISFIVILAQNLKGQKNQY